MAVNRREERFAPASVGVANDTAAELSGIKVTAQNHPQGNDDDRADDGEKAGPARVLARRRNDRNAAVLEALAEDPVRFLTDASMEPDAWQEGVLRSDASRMLLLASRQAGKSSVAAALALKTALLRPARPCCCSRHRSANPANCTARSRTCSAPWAGPWA